MSAPLNTLPDPRRASTFRFVRSDYAAGVAQLVYAFDDGPELIETIGFPGAAELPAERRQAFEAALDVLHLIAGVSYYKAGVPRELRVESTALDRATADLLDALYLHGLGEFAYQNKIDLRGRIRFPVDSADVANDFRSDVGLPRSSLVPIGGGKDSLVSVEILKAAGENATAAWIGNSALIESCAQRSGLPMLNISRVISPVLFEYNRAGALNGHIPVTAINSAILVVGAILYGHDAIVFSNERSASSATLEYDGVAINHQWSKGWDFEQGFRALVHSRIATDLNYYSLLRPLSELAVASRFARNNRYDDVFSSCNRNFRILGPKPSDRWCGQCPKCHFVFLPWHRFMAKARLLGIFGRNLSTIARRTAEGFDALPRIPRSQALRIVGEGRESLCSHDGPCRSRRMAQDTASWIVFRERSCPASTPASCAGSVAARKASGRFLLTC